MSFRLILRTLLANRRSLGPQHRSAMPCDEASDHLQVCVFVSPVETGAQGLVADTKAQLVAHAAVVPQEGTPLPPLVDGSHPSLAIAHVPPKTLHVAIVVYC
jgi:hypothetical protein